MQQASWTRFPDPSSYITPSWRDEGVSALMPQRHESLLRQDPQRYSQMVKGVTAFGIYLIDRDGRVRSWNRGAANITGLTEVEVVGQPFSALFGDEQQREGMPNRTLEFVRANRHCRDEQRRRRRGGEFFAHCTIDALRSEGGELLGFVEVFHDITEQKQREEKLYQRATRDPLTGLFNRGHFNELAAQEIERARRFAEPLSVVMLDIDHFKRINDNHGHDIGDRTIVSLARAVGEHIRKIDFCGRLGGEEFAILLPRANKEPALEFAQRLRRVLSEQRVPVAPGREISYTASLGVASLRSTVRDLADLLRNADAALYKAKREGRNRVEVWFE
jgi:diguanylate cyclase (GGDEF)-like protein/PAS domain S-box-containing protein